MPLKIINEKITYVEDVGVCEMCGEPDELREAYGPNDERICYECGMKDEELTKRKFRAEFDRLTDEWQRTRVH